MKQRTDTKKRAKNIKSVNCTGSINEKLNVAITVLAKKNNLMAA